MATVSVAQIRSWCGMEANYPASATITDWINDLLAMCTGYNAAATENSSNLIIKQRISANFDKTRNQGQTGAQQTTKTEFGALTKDEMAFLDGYVSVWWS